MPRLLFANNAISTLAFDIGAEDVTMVVVNGSIFPIINSGSEYFKVTLSSPTQVGLTEIVNVISRNENNFVIVRAAEGTTAQAWTEGAFVECLVTKGSLDIMQQAGEQPAVNLICDLAATSEVSLPHPSISSRFHVAIIDGVPIPDQGYVFLPVQIHDPKENGAYQYDLATNTLTRAPEMADGNTITSPYYVQINEGDDYGGLTFQLRSSSVIVGVEPSEWGLTSGGGLTVPNSYLAGPSQANARDGIAQFRLPSTMDVPPIAPTGPTSGYWRKYMYWMIQRVPKLSMFTRFRDPWDDQAAFEYCMRNYIEFIVDQQFQFLTAPDLVLAGGLEPLRGRRVIFDGSGWSGRAQLLVRNRNLVPFNIGGTEDLTFDGQLVGGELVAHAGSGPFPLIRATTSFKNFRCASVWSRSFSHAVHIATANEGFSIGEINVEYPDAVAAIPFVSSNPSGSASSFIGNILSIPRFQEIATNADATVTAFKDSPIIDLTGTYSTDRNITLSTDNVTKNATITIKKSGTGFTANIKSGSTTLTSLAAGQQCRVGWDGVAAAWKLV